MKNNLMELTPKKIVEFLDKYIVGQAQAKKAIAIALRSRYRRSKLPDDIKEDVIPKNILMIGPTGVGKTEIAKRVAKIVNAPFVKVEATKFTEIGYVGRDVESIIRDLASVGYETAKTQELEKVYSQAEKIAMSRILDILVPPIKKKISIYEENHEEEEGIKKTREKFREKLEKGEFDDKIIEITIEEKDLSMQIPFIEISQPMMEDFDSNLKNLLSNMLPSKKKTKKVTIKEAKEILKEEEAYNLIDKEKVKEIARELVSNMGIVFIDEIDKIAGKTAGGGPDISREGVQRDLLPIIEGSAINTKIGVIKTDHILFIAAGAFHQTKPSDLIPELQGRFPIRVELQALTKDDFFKILTQPKNALINQYIELLKTEGVNLTFTNEAIKKIAELAEYFNEKNENIGARRLHTLIEKVLEDILFEAPDIQKKDVVVDDEYVMQKVADVVENLDLSKYIL